MRAPTLGRSARRSRDTPSLRKPTVSKPVPGPKVTTWIVRTKPDIWNIGEGPWFWNGQPASRPEYITLIVLKRLGWHPKFQTRIAGGRRIPGGQVLDILLEEASPPIYISVKGYYHQGAAAAYDDKVKEIMAKSVLNNARVIEIWEKDIDQRGWLESYLEREVGVRGR